MASDQAAFGLLEGWKKEVSPFVFQVCFHQAQYHASHYNVLCTPYLIMLHTGCYEYCGLNELCFVHMNCLLLHTELGALDFKYLPA